MASLDRLDRGKDPPEDVPPRRSASFPRKWNKNEDEMLSSEQVIPDISLSLPPAYLHKLRRGRPHRVIPLFLHRRQQQRLSPINLPTVPPPRCFSRLLARRCRIAFCFALCASSFVSASRREEMTNKWAPHSITSTLVAMAMGRGRSAFLTRETPPWNASNTIDEDRDWKIYFFEKSCYKEMSSTYVDEF